MSLDADRREWDDLARRDPMWAVCSVPGRRAAWSREEFLRSGEEEVAGILEGLDREGIDVRRSRALDFGCGLGRLTRALAARFDEAVGVDISAEMVRAARELNADRANCRFLHNDARDLAALADGGFDFVLSLIALQHVSDRDAIRSYLRELVRVAAPGAVLVLQLPSRVALRVRLHPLRVLNRLLRRLPAAPEPLVATLVPHSMRLVALPEAEVRALLEAAGARVLTVFPDGRTGSAAVPSLSYVARV